MLTSVKYSVVAWYHLNPHLILILSISTSLVEVTWSRTEDLSIGEVLQDTGIALTSLGDDVVAPPVDALLGPLEGEEDDDGGNCNTRAECR